MSETYINEKTAAVTEAQPQPARGAEEVKNEQVHSVAESTESSDQGQAPEQEPEQQGRFRRMFEYMKTRDFWLVIILGYVVGSSKTERRMSNSLTNFCRSQSSHRFGRYQLVYLFVPSVSERQQYPCLPDAVELHSSQLGVYQYHHLQIRLQEMVQYVVQGLLEILHPFFPGCRRQLLHGPGLPLYIASER